MLLSQAKWNLWNFATKTEGVAGIMIMELKVMRWCKSGKTEGIQGELLVKGVK